MTGERKEWAHPWFAAVVGPRPSEEVPEEDERRKRRRQPRVLKVRRTM
ncbi:MAG TPA: hypothetical protein VKZ82_23795 [Nonomuraea sp.]|nr:hypothetical protein [Nonomuraea sp.]